MQPGMTAVLCAALVTTVACTAPDPAPPATAAASPAEPMAAPGQSEAPEWSFEATRCAGFTRSKTFKPARVWPSPERAVAAVDHPGPAMGFDPVVYQRGVAFYARNRSASYFVSQTRRGWAVTGKTEPSCPPRAVRQARRYDASDSDLACRRAHGISIAGTGGSQSVLEALHGYTSRARGAGPVRHLPAEPYVFIGVHRRHWPTFGAITAAGLRARIQVYDNERHGAAVDGASWCFGRG